MNLVRTTLLVSIFIASPVLLGAQQSREERVKAIESQLLEMPSAPYKLRASYSGRGFEFCNTSATRVVKFRLGCVEKKKGELHILSERDFMESDLAPVDGELINCHFWRSNHGYFPDQACSKGKMAVIEIVLADGAVWKLKP